MSVARVRFKLSRNPYGRYLYNTVFALTRAGRQVSAAPKPGFWLDTARDPYARYLFSHQGFGLGFRGRTLDVSPDYFSEKAVGRRFPIGMHPLMYRNGWWEAPLDGISRRRSVFFSGNIDPSLYSDVALERRFGVSPRFTILDAVKDVIEWRDSRTNPIPMDQWRPTLAGHDFFLALPGVVMPHAHNLTEAMSVGCIPVIQAAHARWMDPPLRHGVDAWIFDGPDDAANSVSAALELSQVEVDVLRTGAMSYYETYLSPEATVRMADQGGRLYLMAEHHSLVDR